MDDWSPWIKFEDQEPQIGMYIRMEIKCICDKVIVIECIWELNKSERHISGPKQVCIPIFDRWQHRTPKEKKRERKVQFA